MTNEEIDIVTCVKLKADLERISKSNMPDEYLLLNENLSFIGAMLAEIARRLPEVKEKKKK